MTVYVLIPVFNRLELTRRVLGCLRDQRSDERMELIVIDDGSTDGTRDFLANASDITVLNGDGTLWWGGAIDLGLRHVLSAGRPGDWVLLVNNDTLFFPDFLQGLVDTARVHAPAAVGSIVCDEGDPETVISVGAIIDTWRLRVCDKLEARRRRHNTGSPHVVDALSARGTLYPIGAFRAAGVMNPKWLPHYLADYELALRVRKAGYRLLVSEQSVVLSAHVFGTAWRPTGLLDRFFMIRSPSYLPAVVTFWWRVSSFVERLSLLPRLIYVSLVSCRTVQ